MTGDGMRCRGWARARWNSRLKVLLCDFQIVQGHVGAFVAPELDHLREADSGGAAFPFRRCAGVGGGTTRAEMPAAAAASRRVARSLRRWETRPGGRKKNRRSLCGALARRRERMRSTSRHTRARFSMRANGKRVFPYRSESPRSTANSDPIVKPIGHPYGDVPVAETSCSLTSGADEINPTECILGR